MSSDKLHTPNLPTNNGYSIPTSARKKLPRKYSTGSSQLGEKRLVDFGQDVENTFKKMLHIANLEKKPRKGSSDSNEIKIIIFLIL